MLQPFDGRHRIGQVGDDQPSRTLKTWAVLLQHRGVRVNQHHAATVIDKRGLEKLQADIGFASDQYQQIGFDQDLGECPQARIIDPTRTPHRHGRHTSGLFQLRQGGGAGAANRRRTGQNQRAGGLTKQLQDPVGGVPIQQAHDRMKVVRNGWPGHLMPAGIRQDVSGQGDMHRPRSTTAGQPDGSREIVSQGRRIGRLP